MTRAKNDNSVPVDAAVDPVPVDSADTPARPTSHAANRDALAAWCDLSRGVETFRARWKPSILMQLTDGPRGIAQILAGLAGPARRVTVRALRELQADGLVAKSGSAARPFYALTADGQALAPLLAGIARWSETRQP